MLDEGASLEDIARRFGWSSRQIRRIVQKELGVSPIELVLTRRLLLAKQLLTETTLPVIDVAFASGFSSLRRFNDAFSVALRNAADPPAKDGEGDIGFAGVPRVVHLATELPAPVRLAGHDGIRHGPRVERRRMGTRRRLPSHRSARTAQGMDDRASCARPAGAARRAHALTHTGASGRTRTASPRFRSQRTPRRHCREARTDGCARRCRGAQSGAACARRLRRLRAGRAGHSWATDHREGGDDPRGALRCHVRRATRDAARGPHPSQSDSPSVSSARASTSWHPSASSSRERGASSRWPRRWWRARLTLEPGAQPDQTIDRLVALPGIGAWTAQYIAMRALRWPDAFPKEDVALRKNLGGVTAARAEELSEAWRPWRSYATLHLWQEGLRRPQR